MTYPIQPGPFFTGNRKLGKLPNTPSLAGECRPVCRHHTGCSSVEYKLDAFNMPRTGTTLCHPKIGYVDPTSNPALDTQLPFYLWATLMEKVHTLPKYQTQNSRWHPKFNSYNCNMSFVKPTNTIPSHIRRHTLPSQPSHNSILSQEAQPQHESCSTKSKPNIPCCK